MTRPWLNVARVDTADGLLELRQRGDDDFLICIGGRVLMSSAANRSETALASLALKDFSDRVDPVVLIGGLGMGYTLRTALDVLPDSAQVRVAELNPVVVDWCRGPLAALNKDPLADPRVTVELRDVAKMIEAASGGAGNQFDAVLFDLYEGPHAGTLPRRDPLYGSDAIRRTARALRPGGRFAIWSEAPDRAFEQRLRAARFSVEARRPGRGGLRHAVTLATWRP